jgi:hypothetical protein
MVTILIYMDINIQNINQIKKYQKPKKKDK